MKKIYRFSMLFLFLFSGLSFANAQNGNAVISEIQVYDEGDGSATIEIRISGNLASSSISANIGVQGDRIVGGSVFTRAGVTTRCFDCPVILEASVPISSSISSKDDFVDITIDLSNAAIIIKSKSKIGRRPKKYYR